MSLPRFEGFLLGENGVGKKSQLRTVLSGTISRRDFRTGKVRNQSWVGGNIKIYLA